MALSEEEGYRGLLPDGADTKIMVGEVSQTETEQEAILAK